MKKLIYLLLLTVSSSHAQEYLRLTQNSYVYDVEIIVFARLLSQPEASSINSKSLAFNDVLKQIPVIKDNSLELIKPVNTSTNQVNDNDNDNWQVPVTENKVLFDVLSWFKFPTTMNNAVVNRLQNNPTLKPLDYQKWRQPATSFLDPGFVYVASNHLATLEDNATNLILMPNDYEYSGQIAYSRQQFNHAEVKLNFYRLDASGNSIIYNIDQKSRIDLKEWQYFDHQQFGVMVKVTPVLIEVTQ